MLEIIVQVLILLGVWVNVGLGIIALKDRRGRNGLHR